MFRDDRATASTHHAKIAYRFGRLDPAKAPVIENTIWKQSIALVKAPEPCGERGTGIDAPVGRNRFIAPISLAPHRTFWL
jgi:hypothetical protein